MTSGKDSYHYLEYSVTAMADRKAELEKKRRKLEELKKARELNKLQSKDKEVSMSCQLVSSSGVQPVSCPCVLIRSPVLCLPRVTTWPGREKMSTNWLVI